MAIEINNFAQASELLQKGIAQVKQSMASLGVTEADLLKALSSRPDTKDAVPNILAEGGLEGFFSKSSEALASVEAEQKKLLKLHFDQYM